MFFPFPNQIELNPDHLGRFVGIKILTFVRNGWLNDTWMTFLSLCLNVGSAWIVWMVMMVVEDEGRSRLLLVGLLLVSVPRPVLDVGRAGAQPVQVPTVLSVVDVILEEHLSHLKESHSCE